MTIRRFNTRDERRRRASKANVDASGVAASRLEGPDDGETPTLRVLYADGAISDNQPRITDLLPTRVLTLTLLFLAGLGVVGFGAAVAAFYQETFAGSRADVDRILGALAPGSFSSWLAAMIMIFAAVTSSLIFWIRRNRIDDYRGRYRMWIYITGLLVLSSLDASVGLRAVLVAGLSQAAPNLATPNLLYASFVVLGFALVTRLVIEMRRSRGSIAWLVAAVLLYILSALVYGTVVSVPWSGPINVTVSAFLLSGHWLLTMAMVVYARYVFLEAQGLIVNGQSNSSVPQMKLHAESTETDSRSVEKVGGKRWFWQRTRKQASAEPDKPESQEREPTKKSAPVTKRALRRKSKENNPDVLPMKEATPQRTPKRKQSGPKPAPQAEDLGSSDDESMQHLSKAERKRARKEKRRQRRAA